VSKQQRYQSGDSVGSGTNGRTGAPVVADCDHVQGIRYSSSNSNIDDDFIDSIERFQVTQSADVDGIGSQYEFCFDAAMRPDAGGVWLGPDASRI
jgi:hypothetical protein